MIDFGKHEKWAEAYLVEKTIDVSVSIQGEAQTIRIETLRSFKTGRYSTRAYCQQHVSVPPAAPQEHEEPEKQPVQRSRMEPIDMQLWVDLRPTLNLTNETTADAAIERALEFLAQRCD